MRRADLPALVAALEAPLGRFVRESRCRLALLLNGSGQILVQHGFSRELNLGGIATLGAGIHASSRALAGLLGQPGFEHLHQGRGDRQVFIGGFATPGEDLILVVVFGQDTSIGLVRMFFDAFTTEVNGLPVWYLVQRSESAASFEQDLDAGLNRLRDGVEPPRAV
jgi:hypothetical protein